MNTEEAEEVVKSELQKLEETQLSVEQLQSELEQNPQFVAFLSAKKQFDELSSTVWANVEAVMLENNIKSIKTDRVTLTIAEKLSWNIDLDELPRGFKKLVADTKKLSDFYKLTGKVQKGTEPKYTKYLTKRLK